MLAPETPFTGGADLVMDPTNSDRLYAVMWDHRREPDVRTYGGVGSGLFRTDDGGDTWKRLQNVLTFTPGNANGPADESGLASDETLGRIGVAVAPSDPNRVYVITTHTFGQDKGFYVSNDAGESFNTAARPGSQGGFGWWFGRIWVDPANKDHLFVAGVNLRQSFDGGLTWGNSGGVHADQHGLQWDDEVANLVYLGNDGGLYRSDTNGATGTWTKATHEPYTQHYQVEVAETDPTRVTGGTQDNGCIRSWPGTPTSVERLRLRRRRVRPDRLERRADLVRLLAVRGLPALRRAQRHAHQHEHPGRHDVDPVQLARAAGDRSQQPVGHLLRRQPAPPVHRPRRHLVADQPGGTELPDRHVRARTQRPDLLPLGHADHDLGVEDRAADDLRRHRHRQALEDREPRHHLDRVHRQGAA